jgi:hypothetical protein
MFRTGIMNSTNFFDITSQRILYFLLIFLSVFELINGYFSFYHNLTLIGLFYKSLIIFLAIILIAFHRWKFETGIIILCGYSLFLLLSGLRLCRSDVAIEAIAFDFQYTSRSLLILISIFIFAVSLNKNELITFFKKFLWVQWIIITLAIFIHVIFGFGGVYSKTGEYLRPGYTSFFYAGDPIAIIYVACWLVIISTVKNNLVRVLLTIITLFIVTACASKLGIFLIFFILSLNLFIRLFQKSKVLFVLTLIFISSSFLLIALNLENIIWWFLNYYKLFSKEGSKMAEVAMEYGIISALWSKRNVLLSLAIDKITNYNLKDLFLGANYFNYKRLLGSNIGMEFRNAEVDPIDLVGSTGILGLILAYGVLFIFILKSLRNKQNIKNQLEKNYNINYVLICSRILLMLFVSSIVTGHVFTEPYSNILLGLVYGLIYKLCNNSEGRTTGVC